MFEDESEFRKIIDRLNIDTGPDLAHRDDLRRQLLRVFNEPKQQSQKPVTPNGILRRTIMKNPITKLAAAAVIIIAILVGLPFFSSNGSSVVLADVLERIEQTQAFMYRMKMTMTGAMMSGIPDGKKEMEGTIVISNEYGMKMEITTTDADSGAEEMTQQMYLLPDQKLMLLIMPGQKKYTRMELDDDLIARQKKQNNDPREMMKQILACKYTELGRSEINGIEVEGFETTDPMFSAGVADNVEVKLWVDVKTWLPVLWEMDMKMNERMSMHGVISDFQWDIPVVASDFEPVIPEDYTAMIDDGYKVPSMTEEAALEGLEFFAEMSGKYPKKVGLMSLMQEFQALLKNRKDLIEAGQRLDEEMGRLTIEERSKNIMDLMRPVQSLGMFYMTLVQDKKEPAYYGDTVTVQDVEKVLMRWKVSDDEYRVIFGDLSALDVSADELAGLEKASIDDGYKMPSVTEEAAPEGTGESTAIDHYDRGETHYFDAEYDQAFSELTKAIEKDPTLARAYETRGTAYNDKKEFDLAIADFTKVIELKPADAHAYVSRGVAYGNKGQYDLAVADYSKAIEIDPTVAGAYGCRARAYYYKGEYDKAWKDVYKAQALGRKVDSKLLEKLPKASGTDR